MKLPIIGNNPVNDRYLSMIRKVLSTINLYYSNYEDLSRRLQGSCTSFNSQPDTECRPLSDEDRLFPVSMDSEFMVHFRPSPH